MLTERLINRDSLIHQDPFFFIKILFEELRRRNYEFLHIPILVATLMFLSLNVK